MFLGQVLQFVVIAIAAQAHRAQHQDLPVTEAGPPLEGVAGSIDVLGDERQDFITSSVIGIEMLQGREDGHNFITAVNVEGHLGNRDGIQRRRPGISDTHSTLLGEDDRGQVHISGEFGKCSVIFDAGKRGFSPETVGIFVTRRKLDSVIVPF